MRMVIEPPFVPHSGREETSILPPRPFDLNFSGEVQFTRMSEKDLTAEDKE